MKIERIELYHISMPLVHPFETSLGLETHRECILVAARADGLTGWGECVASIEPGYSYETIGTGWHILSDFLIPAVLSQDWEGAGEFVALTGWVRGHQMAKAALEAAAWDLLAQRDGVSLSAKLAEFYPEGPRDRVSVGVSIGIQPTIEGTLARIEDFLAQGYGRIKLKIKPGRDLDLARAARAAFPAVPLMLDANSAYTLDDAPIFLPMDELNLLMIEQPLAHDDIFQHSKLQAQLQTPICLDESIHTPRLTRAGSSTSSPAGWGAYGRRARFMISARRRVCRSGVEGCWKRESAGRRTWHWQHCPTLFCPATSLPPNDTGRKTLWTRFSPSMLWIAPSRYRIVPVSV